MNKQEIKAIHIGPPAPTGVEGWLLLLCLILAVGSPVQGLYTIVLHSIPSLVRSNSFRLTYLLSVYCVVFAGLMVYSVIAGLRLWLMKPGAVGFAKRYLCTYLIANIAYFVLWIIVMQPKQSDRFAEMGWYHVVGPVLPFTLWYFYLEHSKRVRATYTSDQTSKVG